MTSRNGRCRSVCEALNSSCRTRWTSGTLCSGQNKKCCFCPHRLPALAFQLPYALPPIATIDFPLFHLHFLRDFQQLCSVSFTLMDVSSPMLLTLHSTSTSLRVFLFMSGIFSPILSQLIFMFLSPMRVSSLFAPTVKPLTLPTCSIFHPDVTSCPFFHHKPVRHQLVFCFALISNSQACILVSCPDLFCAFHAATQIQQTKKTGKGIVLSQLATRTEISPPRQSKPNILDKYGSTSHFSAASESTYSLLPWRHAACRWGCFASSPFLRDDLKSKASRKHSESTPA